MNLETGAMGMTFLGKPNNWMLEGLDWIEPKVEKSTMTFVDECIDTLKECVQHLERKCCRPSCLYN